MCGRYVILIDIPWHPDISAKMSSNNECHLPLRKPRPRWRARPLKRSQRPWRSCPQINWPRHSALPNGQSFWAIWTWRCASHHLPKTELSHVITCYHKSCTQFLTSLNVKPSAIWAVEWGSRLAWRRRIHAQGLWIAAVSRWWQRITRECCVDYNLIKLKGKFLDFNFF